MAEAEDVTAVAGDEIKPYRIKVRFPNCLSGRDC